jgi:AcrR family transcriptional regulator
MADSVKAVPLTTARVLDEAMRLADEGGIEAVSLRRLGAELGVTPMALYHYVRDDGGSARVGDRGHR